jgi:hypothetical protein
MTFDRDKYDHPEHFDDEIREYKSSKRYKPTALEDSLLEVAGHKCTICKAPYCEIHHIKELSKGGLTNYENLIVLCPNCHTRVHSENKPNPNQLKHYKLKQEIEFGLPVISKLQQDEKQLIAEISNHIDMELPYVGFRKSWTDKIINDGNFYPNARSSFGLIHLEEQGVIDISIGEETLIDGGNEKWFTVNLKLSGKGIKWIKYLRESDKIESLIK